MSRIVNQATVVTNFLLPNSHTQTLRILTNSHHIDNISQLFQKNRTSSTDFPRVNQEINFFLTLNNTSEHEIYNVFIQDLLDSELQFTPNSVKINDEKYPDLNIVDGFNLPKSISPNSSVKISYAVKLVKPPRFLGSSSISKITYSTQDLINATEFSNKITTKVLQKMIQIIKSADKSTAKHGEIIHFIDKITNLGGDITIPFKFIDRLPAQSQFVVGSVKINSDLFPKYDPTVGFNIDGIKANETITVEYEVKII